MLHTLKKIKVMYKIGEEVRAGFSEEVSWKWKLDGKESAAEDGLEISPSGQIQRLFSKK